MRKLYENKPVLFAVLFIVLYCAVTIPIRGGYGDGSIQSILGLSAITAFIAVVSSIIPLWKKLGVAAKAQNARMCLYFIPMIILATGNIWDGIEMHYSGAALWYAIGSMALVGFVEEMIFRGFLFRALLKKDGPSICRDIRNGSHSEPAGRNGHRGEPDDDSLRSCLGLRIHHGLLQVRKSSALHSGSRNNRRSFHNCRRVRLGQLALYRRDRRAGRRLQPISGKACRDTGNGICI